jgi:hypothetical protein
VVGGGSVVGGGAGVVARGVVATGTDGTRVGALAWVVGVPARAVVGAGGRAGGVVVGGRFGAGNREDRSACAGACRFAFAAAGDCDAVPAGWPASDEATAALAATAPSDNAAVVVPIATVARRRRATDASAEGRTRSTCLPGRDSGASRGHRGRARGPGTDARPPARRRRLSGI